MVIEGISVPDTRLAREITELVRGTESDLLFYHSSRVYCFGAIAGRKRGRTQAQHVPADLTQHHPTARRPEVDRGDADGRGAGRHRRPGHRRKAAATPASTGMCRPVVWLSSSVQSTKTALAMLSGSTSRLRIVRCA